MSIGPPATGSSRTTDRVVSWVLIALGISVVGALAGVIVAAVRDRRSWPWATAGVVLAAAGSVAFFWLMNR